MKLLNRYLKQKNEKQQKYLQQNHLQNLGKGLLSGFGDEQLKSHQNYQIGNSNFHTILKIRPLNSIQKSINDQETIEVLDQQSVAFQNQGLKDIKLISQDQIFRFHRTIPSNFDNKLLYKFQLESLAIDAINGISNALFIIGGQQSGQTHTLLGNGQDPGILILFVEKLFQILELQRFDVFISFIEYVKDFQDCLCKGNGALEPKTTPVGSFLPGVSSFLVANQLHFLKLLKIALKNNAKRDFNRDEEIITEDAIEKSHFIVKFTIFNQRQYNDVENFIALQKNPEESKKKLIIDIDNLRRRKFIRKEEINMRLEENLTDIEKEEFIKWKKINEQKVNYSEVFFVDTESYDASDAMRSHGINDSIIALDNCLRQLSDVNTGVKDDLYIPYQSSKFTSFFQDYLGGRNQCYLIGTVSPFKNDVDESNQVCRWLVWGRNATYKYIHREQDFNFGDLENQEYFNKQSATSSSPEFKVLRRLHKNFKNMKDELQKIAEGFSDVSWDFYQSIQVIFDNLFALYNQIKSEFEKLKQIRNQLEMFQNEMLETELSVVDPYYTTDDVMVFFNIQIVGIMYNIILDKCLRSKSKINQFHQDLAYYQHTIQENRKIFREIIENKGKSIIVEQLKQIQKEIAVHIIHIVQCYYEWTQIIWNNVNFSFACPYSGNLDISSSRLNINFDAIVKSNVENIFSFIDMMENEVKTIENERKQLSPKANSSQTDLENNNNISVGRLSPKALRSPQKISQTKIQQSTNKQFLDHPNLSENFNDQKTNIIINSYNMTLSLTKKKRYPTMSNQQLQSLLHIQNSKIINPQPLINTQPSENSNNDIIPNSKEIDSPDQKPFSIINLPTIKPLSRSSNILQVTPYVLTLRGSSPKDTSFDKSRETKINKTQPSQYGIEGSLKNFATKDEGKTPIITRLKFNPDDIDTSLLSYQLKVAAEQKSKSKAVKKGSMSARELYHENLQQSNPYYGEGKIQQIENAHEVPERIKHQSGTNPYNLIQNIPEEEENANRVDVDYEEHFRSKIKKLQTKSSTPLDLKTTESTQKYAQGPIHFQQNVATTFPNLEVHVETSIFHDPNFINRQKGAVVERHSFRQQIQNNMYDRKNYMVQEYHQQRKQITIQSSFNKDLKLKINIEELISNDKQFNNFSSIIRKQKNFSTTPQKRNEVDKSIKTNVQSKQPDILEENRLVFFKN